MRVAISVVPACEQSTMQTRDPFNTDNIQVRSSQDIYIDGATAPHTCSRTRSGTIQCTAPRRIPAPDIHETRKSPGPETQTTRPGIIHPGHTFPGSGTLRTLEPSRIICPKQRDADHRTYSAGPSHSTQGRGIYTTQAPGRHAPVGHKPRAPIPGRPRAPPPKLGSGTQDNPQGLPLEGTHNPVYTHAHPGTTSEPRGAHDRHTPRDRNPQDDTSPRHPTPTGHTTPGPAPGVRRPCWADAPRGGPMTQAPTPKAHAARSGPIHV